MSPGLGPRTPDPVSRASLRAWLAAREPSPPQALATRLAECVDAAPEEVLAGDAGSEVLGALGAWLLEQAVHGRRGAYDAALDLLAADAFVTYAFEAASEEGADVADLANGLLSRVSA